MKKIKNFQIGNNGSCCEVVSAFLQASYEAMGEVKKTKE